MGPKPSWAASWRVLRSTRPASIVHRVVRDARRIVHDLVPTVGAAWRSEVTPARRSPVPVRALPAPSRGSGPFRIGSHLVDPTRSIPWDGAGWTDLDRVDLHAWSWADAVDDATLATHLEAWREAAPEGARRSYAIAWNGYVVSLRLGAFVVALTDPSRAWSDAVRDMLYAQVAAHARHLVHHLERDLGGNHLLENARALLEASTLFLGDEADGWRALGQELVLELVADTVLPDGMHDERSATYHRRVTVDLLAVLPVLGPVAAARLRAILPRMVQVAIDLSAPDGGPVLFNDARLEHGTSLDEVVARARFVDLDIPAPRPSFDLPGAGFAGWRHRRHAVWVDAGPLAPDHLMAHGHADIGTFEWVVDGQRLVVDPGVYAYAGPTRATSRGTLAHNTITVDGLDQAELIGSFRTGRRPTVTRRVQVDADGLCVEVAHDGYAHLRGRPVPVRTLVAHEAGLDVVDEVRGGDGQRATAGLLLHPEVAVEATGRGWMLRRAASEVHLVVDAEVTVVEADWWPDIGVARPTRRLTWSLGCAPCAVHWSLTLVAPDGGVGTTPGAGR